MPLLNKQKQKTNNSNAGNLLDKINRDLFKNKYSHLEKIS